MVSILFEPHIAHPLVSVHIECERIKDTLRMKKLLEKVEADYVSAVMEGHKVFVDIEECILYSAPLKYLLKCDWVGNVRVSFSVLTLHSRIAAEPDQLHLYKCTIRNAPWGSASAKKTECVEGYIAKGARN